MIIPDLIGMTPNEARQVLAEGFPQVKYRFQTYLSPKKRNREGTEKVAYLVIRQIAMGANVLELTISPFSKASE